MLKAVRSYLAYDGTADATLTVRTRGRGANGKLVHATVAMPGDPGIYVTALCAAETTLAMLECARGAAALPPGFTTPMHACGDVLVARLKAAKGVTVECA